MEKRMSGAGRSLGSKGMNRERHRFSMLGRRSATSTSGGGQGRETLRAAIDCYFDPDHKLLQEALFGKNEKEGKVGKGAGSV